MYLNKAVASLVAYDYRIKMCTMERHLHSNCTPNTWHSQHNLYPPHPS
jgi:hypothetical protein